MTSKRCIVGIRATARTLARGLLVVALGLAGANPARADVSLYQAAVPLKGTTEADRAAAFGEALKVAAVRASGRPEAATSPRVVAAAAEPMGYVQQYSTTTDHVLKVGFDARTLEQVLLQAGLPLWPAERPVTTVYLFPAGATRALASADSHPDHASLEQAAQLRGVPLAWPAEAVELGQARGRLASGTAALIGVADAGGYQWSFAQAGLAANAKGGLNEGVDLVADTLATRYAPASTRSLNALTVRIGSLDNVGAYAALTRYLEGLSLVRSLAVTELAGNTVQVQLGVRGDLELLRRILALDARLVPAASAADGAAASGGTPVDFNWRQ